jgi:hypothetical protein
MDLRYGAIEDGVLEFARASARTTTAEPAREPALAK